MKFFLLAYLFRQCKYILALIWLHLPLTSQCQYADTLFQSPIDHEIVLSGSFGELRSNHFHAGIDLKPESTNSIDSIRSAEKGFVSRIKIQTGGYGRALYIDHPNGYTTVYAHLQKFSDTLEAFIREKQLSNKSFEVDIYPRPEKLPIDRGAFIGLMGNTGRSYGKHLHFEIRDTKSEIPINPALFGLKPNDNISPTCLSLDIKGLDPEFRETYSKTFYPTQQGNYLTIGSGSITVPAWSCGISVQSFDRMNGAQNRNGVYVQRMFLDDSLVFSSKMERVCFDESKYINSHIDYASKKEQNRTMVKCFRLPGNELNVYDHLKEEGIIKIYQDIERKVRIELSDIEENKTIIEFSILRADKIPEPEFPSYHVKIIQGKKDTINFNSIKLFLNNRSLDRNKYLSYQSEEMENGLTLHSIGKESDFLFSWAKLEMETDHIPENLKSKATIIRINDKGKEEYVGGEVQKEKIVGSIRNLGKFYVGLDTIPPVIKEASKRNGYRNDSNLIFHLDDNYVEPSYDVYIDNEWTISPYKVLTKRLSVPLVGLESGIHELHIKARDNQGNVTSFKKSITIIN